MESSNAALTLALPIEYPVPCTQPESALNNSSPSASLMDSSASSAQHMPEYEDVGTATRSPGGTREGSPANPVPAADTSRKRRKRRLPCLEEGCTKEFTSEYTRKVSILFGSEYLLGLFSGCTWPTDGVVPCE